MSASNAISDMVSNPTYVGIYFAVLMILLVMIVFYLRSSRKERMTNYGVAGGGIQDQVFTAGASQRFAQDFSQPGQGVHATPYNQDIMAVAGAVMPASKERLVNGGGYPDFWEITSELGAYRDEQVDSYRGAQKGGAAPQAAAAAAGVGPERFQAQAAQDALSFAMASGNMNPYSAQSMLYA